MNYVPMGAVVTYHFSTHLPSTGAQTAADAVPVLKAFASDTVTAIATIACASSTSEVATYYGGFTTSAASGWVTGVVHNVIAVATVSAITGRRLLGTFIIGTTAVSAGVVNAYVAGVTVTTMGVTVTLAAGVTVTAVASGGMDTATLGAVSVSAITVGVTVTTMGVGVTLNSIATGSEYLFGIIATGTAQSATATTLVLSASFSATDDVMIGATIYLYSGTNDLYDRSFIYDWDNTTKTAYVDPPWTVTPTGTLKYILYATPRAGVSSIPAVDVTKVNGTAVVSTTAHLGVKVVSFVTGAATASAFATAALASSTVLEVTNGVTVSGTVAASVGAVSVSAMTVNVTVSTMSVAVTVTAIVTGAVTASAIATAALALSTILNATVSNTVAASVGAVSVSAMSVNVTVSTMSVGVTVTAMVTGAVTATAIATAALAASTILNATVSGTVAVGAVAVSAMSVGVTVTEVGSTAIAAIATGLLDMTAGVETGWTLRQWFRVAASALFGKASGMASTTAVYRDVGDTKARITATVDSNGNRTAVTTDAT